jgi:protein-S-isoprenylcysteine O-methyltransferase Ste14
LRPILALVDLPPVWLALHVGAALAMAQGSPAVLGAGGQWAGQVLVGLGVVITLVAAAQLVLHSTTVIPCRTPTALVTTGLFAFSRNPIYLADALILLGAILIVDAVLALPLVAVFVWLIQTRFIRDEEARLTMAFGPEFDLWSARTRRWIGRKGTALV